MKIENILFQKPRTNGEPGSTKHRIKRQGNRGHNQGQKYLHQRVIPQNGEAAAKRLIRFVEPWKTCWTARSNNPLYRSDPPPRNLTKSITSGKCRGPTKSTQCGDILAKSTTRKTWSKGKNEATSFQQQERHQNCGEVITYNEEKPRRPGITNGKWNKTTSYRNFPSNTSKRPWITRAQPRHKQSRRN